MLITKEHCDVLHVLHIANTEKHSFYLVKSMIVYSFYYSEWIIKYNFIKNESPVFFFDAVPLG